MAFIVGALGAALVALAGCGLVEAKEELESRAADVLVALQEGQHEKVYAEASQVFRDAATPELFRRYVEVRRQALGALRRVVDNKGFSVNSESGKPTLGKIGLVVEYERGTAQTEFQFLKEGGTWRLSHLKIAFDESLLPQPDRGALEPLARSLLDLYDASSFVALYAKFAKPLQDAWPATKFETDLPTLREGTGKVLEATLRDTKDEEQGKVRLTFDVRFESGPGETDALFQWADGAWHVIGWHLKRNAR